VVAPARPAVLSLTLIALSGLGQEEDKRRATEAGFDVHFTKPVDIQALNELLASIAAERPGRPGEPGA
jgi:CheY-like chemotaxis protein